jgi:hypothetical protein
LFEFSVFELVQTLYSSSLKRLQNGSISEQYLISMVYLLNAPFASPALFGVLFKEVYQGLYCV